MGSFFMRTANILIRLGGCLGSSESSLGVQVIIHVVLSVLCGGTFRVVKPYHDQFYGCLTTTELLHIHGYFCCKKDLVVILFSRYFD